MKKYFTGIVFGFFLALSVNAAANSYFQFVASQNTLYVNGKKVEIPMYNYQNTNYASIRGVAEALDLDITVTGTRIDLTSKSHAAEKTTVEIAQNVESTVFIRTYDTVNMNRARLLSTGSGVVLDNGLIITNFHVVQGGLRYGIVYNNTPEGQEYRTSSWINVDKSRDICILPSPDTNVKGVVVGNSDNFKIGEKVIAIGSPLGLKNTVSEGIVSGFRKIDGYNYIQITAPISPGSSGGGLFNSRGELIGITTSKIVNGESLNFAIPINDVMAIVNRKETQLFIELSKQMQKYSYNNQHFYFNAISSIDNNGILNVSYFLFEEYEGSSKFEYLYENSSDFRNKLSNKLVDISKIIKDYGFKKFYINFYPGTNNKNLSFMYENDSLKVIENRFVIK